MTEPRDPNYEKRVRDSFSRQRVMNTFGAELTGVSPGKVEITITYRPELTQQHGYIHAGVLSTIMDSACGYAALSLAAADAAVLAVEFKANFLAPAVGDKIMARGGVVRSGRTLTVCNGEAYAITGGDEKLVATMLSTIMTVTGRDISD